MQAIKGFFAGTGKVEFFKDRDALHNRFPISKIFSDNNNELHGYFLRGEGLFSDSGNIKKMERIILPNPDGEYLKYFQSIDSNSYFTLEQIITTTKLVQEHNKSVEADKRAGDKKKVEIKWFHDYIGYGILFCNPRSDNGWVHIEFSLPGYEAKNKPAIRIEKALQKEAFEKLYKSFEFMWLKSKNPPENLE